MMDERNELYREMKKLYFLKTNKTNEYRKIF